MDRHSEPNFNESCIPVGATKIIGILRVTTILVDGKYIIVNPLRTNIIYPESRIY